LARDPGYVEPEAHAAMVEQLSSVKRMIVAFSRALKDA
jgi:hypothetical protein